MNYLIYTIFFLYGIIIGSFLNVCILRIPNKTFFTKKRSHCPQCQATLRWYDLIPIFSYLCLRGKCRNCRKPISIQYPLIEALNGILYVWVAAVCLHNLNLGLYDAILYCLLTSALIVISVVDIKTFTILPQLNIFILILGLFNLAIHIDNWELYIIGFFTISVPMFLLVLLNAMGDGDMKLMAVAGLLLGWKLIILSFMLACILGTIIHLCFMIVKKKGRQLPFGPYLSAGILLSALYGEQIIEWYINMLL